MELKNLNAFLEVARQKSFSKAADKLYISQSAISKRISKLETELSTILFDRIGKTVNLTEVGHNLLQPAQTILRKADNLKQMVATLSNTVSGTLIMATSHHIGLHRLSPVLKKFSQNYPDVKLDVRFMDSEQACAKVEHGDIELAIVTLPDQAAPALRMKTLWVDNLVFVSDKKHPLAKLSQVCAQDLAQHPAVLPAKETFTRTILENAVGKENLKLSMATNYLETIKMLALAGLGWSILPKTMLDKDLCLLKTSFKLKRKLGAITHKDRTLSNAAKAMLKMTQKL